MILLFLDIDGVLNDHSRRANGYSGICATQVSHLNTILDTFPTLQIVISSAWRYIVLSGESTLKGFEHLLLTHGIKCKDRLHGTTEADGRSAPNLPDGSYDVEAWSNLGLEMRHDQILRYVDAHKPAHWLAIDDLALDLPYRHFVQTDGNKGLDSATKKRAIELLSQPVSIGPTDVSIEPTTEPPTLRPGATVRVLKDTKSINGLNLPAGQLLRVTSHTETMITARIGEHGEGLVATIKSGDVEVVG